MPHTGPLVRALAVAATGLMAAATLGACSDGEQSSGAAVSSSPEPSASSSPEPSMSGGYVVGPDGKLLKPTDAPVPVLPETPASITENTPEAAEDFARYFVAVTEYAWNSGDTTRLKEISSDGCEMCSSFSSTIEDRVDKGGWVLGLKYKVLQIDSMGPHPEDSSRLIFVIHINSSAESAYTGSRIVLISPKDELLEMHTCFSDSWIACGGGAGESTDSG